MFKRLRSQAGAALVEYSLLIAGVALVGAAAVSIFGHKTTDLMAAVAAVLPGAHADDNFAIISGKIIETTNTGQGEEEGAGATPGIALDINAITGSFNTDTARLGNQLGLAADANVGLLVLEAGDGT